MAKTKVSLIVLLFVGSVVAQTKPPARSALSAAFAKAAIKLLTTTKNTHHEELIDAAVAETEAMANTPVENDEFVCLKGFSYIYLLLVQLGRLPWSYDQVWRMYQKAAGKAGIGKLSTHSLRHTYRTWLDSVGTPVGVQQKLMRHADIRTTMNTYGNAATADMAEAHGKVVRLALPNGR
jgi:integrase